MAIDAFVALFAQTLVRLVALRDKKVKGRGALGSCCEH
jgi:hypothetical protein